MGLPKKFKEVMSVNCGLGDTCIHNMVCFSRRAHRKKRVPRFMYRSYRKYDKEKFVTELSMAPFQAASLFDDVNDSYWFCNELLKDLVDEQAALQ